MAGWLSAGDVGGVVAESMCNHLGVAGNGALQLSFARALGAKGSRGAVVDLLGASGVLDALADKVWENARRLAHAGVATSTELNNKFMAEEGTFDLSCGGLSTFFSGLEGLVGSPQVQMTSAMEQEHCGSTDSDIYFQTSNYQLTTTSRMEWHFVVSPEMGPPDRGGEAAWPTEHQAPKGRDDLRRKPLPLSDFIEAMDRRNAELEEAGEPQLIEVEAIGLRLYTGPMFNKYNTTLRGLATEFMRRRWEDLCHGNMYVTTLHVINSGIVKLGKVMKAGKVYRGISGGLLPPEFWSPNKFGVCGGVEFAFMSTTNDRSVAMHYAGSGKAGTIFEISMGMVDRGADLSWISQYPHEEEICFAPLTGLEVVSTSVEGSVLVVQVRLNINLSSLTIEQVLSKKRKVIYDMGTAMRLEVRNELVKRADGHYDADGKPLQCWFSGVSPIRGKRYQHREGYSICANEYAELGNNTAGWNMVPDATDWAKNENTATARGLLVGSLVHALTETKSAEWFNDDDNFMMAVGSVLELEKQVKAASLDSLELSRLDLVGRLPPDLGRAGMKRLRIIASQAVHPKLPSFAGALSTGSSLRTLDLSCNDLGPEEVCLVADGLPGIPCLEELDLSGNRVGHGWRSDAAATMRWGARRGPKIAVEEDGLTATDVAEDPRDGDDGGGRYRVLIAEDGFASGVHKWSVKVKSRGRLLVGAVTSEVDASWREGIGRSLHQVDQAWIVAPFFSDADKNMNKWHAGKSWPTGLPPLQVNGCLQMILNCEDRTLTFLVDGFGGDKEATLGNVFTKLPAGKTFFPAVAFGGDRHKGVCVELCEYQYVGVNLRGVHALADALQGCDSLTLVNLENNSLCDDAKTLLRDAVPSTCALRFEALVRWGCKRGPKINVSEDGLTATDVAGDPTTGDDGGGRYRVVVAEEGFSSGVHTWSLKIKSPGRLLIGVVTSEVDASWREGNGRSLHQVAQAWTVCPDSDNTHKWHAGESSLTGLPPLPVNGCLQMILSCEDRLLTFRVDGSGGDTGGNMFNLPAGKTFFPAIAFGGDKVQGACVELCL